MSIPIRTCALVGKFNDARVAESADALVAALGARGLAAIALAGTEPVPQAVEPVGLEALLARADVLISVGGDGTLLSAAGLVAGHDIPLLGINRGRLGFLADVLPQDIEVCLDALLAGQCQADRRPLLRADLIEAGGRISTHYALNDVVLNRLATGRMLDFETTIDGRHLNAYGGDGLVVATATGSTAYALSCGGPIVEPRLPVLVIAPICPHTMSHRPIVVPDDCCIEIRLVGRHQTEAQVTCDASVLGELGADGHVRIQSSGRSVTLLHPPGYDYFRLLRSKLHWGAAEPNHER